MRNSRIFTVAVSATTCIALAGCSATNTSMDHSSGEMVTTVNGEVPPNPVTKVTSSSVILDVTEDGTRHLVMRDVRPADTRSPIHMHPYGGLTCMVSGEMTLYLEGSEPQVAGPGQCYWMPPGKPMSGVNTGGVEAVLTDIFNVPEGESVWEVVEKGQEEMQENFKTGNNSESESPSPSRDARGPKAETEIA